MGCFVAPVTSAIAAGCASSWLAKYRKSLLRLSLCEGAVGVVSLAEHIYHGEVTTTWPYLTGLATEATRMTLARELVTEGALLALAGIALWAVWSAALVYYHHRTAVRTA